MPVNWCVLLSICHKLRKAFGKFLRSYIFWACIKIWWNFVSRTCFWMNHSPGLLWWSSIQIRGQMRSKFRLVGLENSQSPSTSKVWPSDNWEQDKSCASTALYMSFLKHYTLTNKKVGTLWRVLSKSPQSRQSPYPLPLWLLVATPIFIYFWNILFLSPYMFV